MTFVKLVNNGFPAIDIKRDNSNRNWKSRAAQLLLQYSEGRVSNKNEKLGKAFQLFWDRVDKIRSRPGRKKNNNQEDRRFQLFWKRIDGINYQRNYYATHKDELKLKQRHYQQQKNLLQLQLYRKSYYERNKDRITQKRLQYYRKNRDRIIQRQLENYRRRQSQGGTFP